MSGPAGTRPVKRGSGLSSPGRAGSGRLTLAALLAHLFAREGMRVLAIDGDPQQNLAATLGIPRADAERIVPVSESADYLREKTGAGSDVSPGRASHAQPRCKRCDRPVFGAGRLQPPASCHGKRERGGWRVPVSRVYPAFRHTPAHAAPCRRGHYP